MSIIEGKTVVVTGANRGLGRELVNQLLERPGNTIIAGVRDPSQAKDLASLGPNVVVTQLDVSDEASIEAWAASLKKDFAHIDVVINNAGIADMEPFGSLKGKLFHSIFQTNAIGPFLVVQSLHGQGLIGGSGGHTLVATVSSTMGSISENRADGLPITIGLKPGGAIPYRSSKSAVNSIMKSLSHDLADQDITVTLLCPGYVATDMNGHSGHIDTQTSVNGMLKVLEENKDLQGSFHYYTGQYIPW
ncbi:putative oxidoreductase [Auxenochlorella protothecoides]|uniref:Putative oxidoreductase n=2 Tax=Auxenochlorella protothecoides TaxID=3075 RepID=A0A087SQM4_AUXPR|nr:putative oxidoreductase [Auxenochlorella protothecoides]KFM28028.1 putative oxidoreductase [Auxenochlorella protothecoides]